jgi:ribosomal protein L11 methyltransferase
LSWIAVRVRPGAANEKDRIVAALIDVGAQGVQEDGDLLVTYLPGNTMLRPVERAIALASPLARADFESAIDIDARRQWRCTVGMQRVGTLTIAPPWLAHEAGNGEGTIVIDPAMAFGTGEHPTTRGMLQLMQRVVRRGDTVADLGAGSAVLSIAAARLGASRVVAIEVDPDAIGNAEANVHRNDVASLVTILNGDARVLLPLVAPVRVVLANILSSVLVDLSPAMRAALSAGGQAVVSGILRSERSEFVARMSDDGWRVEDEDVEGEWYSATLGVP